MSERIYDDAGQWIAVLAYDADGWYLAPPVVLDADDEVVMGREVLAAAAQADVRELEHPVIRVDDAGDLAELEQRLAAASARLGVRLASL